MARISSHMVFMASYPLELGAATPLFFALRERERVLDLLESVTGGRFHPNFNRIGGVKPAAGSGSTMRKQIQDLPKGFLAETREAMDNIEEAADQLEDLVAGNEIILARTKGIGVSRPRSPPPTGCPAPTCAPPASVSTSARSRTTCPTTGSTSPCRRRERRLLGPVVGAARGDPAVGQIIRQAIDGIPSGPLQAKVPKVIKVPAGETYVRAENPKGEMGYYLVSDGGQGPYRLKIRSASFSNISILPWALEGAMVPDIIAIMGSLDFVLGDVDR
jgi:NADH-quinone oxidoreductase subunit D